MSIRSALLACFVVSLAGCPAKPEAAPRDSYTYTLSLDESVTLPKDTPAPTLIVSGKEAGKLGSPLTLTLPADKFLTNAAVLLRIESTCGFVDLPADWTLTRALEERDRGGEAAIESAVKLQKPVETARVYLDNVQGKQPVDVELGKLKRTLDPGKHWKGEVVLGSCPEAKKVAIGGKELGTLTTEDRKAALVDASGTSCYEVAFITYVTDPSRPPPPGWSERPTRLAGKRVHEIDVPEYFLENPPQSKQTKDDLHVVRALRHAPCGR